jgi:hypothetical protein
MKNKTGRQTGRKTAKKTAIALAVLALLAVPIAWAICTTTQVNFYIGTVVAYTLTLPGQTAVNANSTCAPTAAITFNSTSGTDTNLDPYVVGGNSQNSTVPIFQFANTGTVNLNLSVLIDSALPACITLTGNTTYATAGNGYVIGTSNVTVVDNLTPTSTEDWFMQADFSACTSGDTTTRTITSYGVQS